MTPAATNIAVPAAAWLSQGDIFRTVPILRAGVADAVATAALQNGPSMLISHGCAIDKKDGRGRSTLEYLTFLPLHDVSALESSRAKDLRQAWDAPKPYKVMYLGHVPEVGEGYVDLTEPYTLPALLLRTELKRFSADQTGETEDDRVVATMHQTRVATLTSEALLLFQRKWSIQWTRMDPFADEQESPADR